MGLFDLFKSKQKNTQESGYSKPINYTSLDNVEIPKPHVMNIKPAGVTFENRQATLEKIYKKKKPFDKQLNIEFVGVDINGELAIEIRINNCLVGYVEKKRINEFVKHKDYGYKITKFFPGYHEDSKTYYCTIKVEFSK